MANMLDRVQAAVRTRRQYRAALEALEMPTPFEIEQTQGVEYVARALAKYETDRADLELAFRSATRECADALEALVGEDDQEE
jgi:hypothetical protein